MLIVYSPALTARYSGDFSNADLSYLAPFRINDILQMYSCIKISSWMNSLRDLSIYIWCALTQEPTSLNNLRRCPKKVKKILWASTFDLIWEAICQIVLDVKKRLRKFLRNGTIRVFTLKCLNALTARNRSKPITVKENSVTPFRRQNNLAKWPR